MEKEISMKENMVKNAEKNISLLSFLKTLKYQFALRPNPKQIWLLKSIHRPLNNSTSPKSNNEPQTEVWQTKKTPKQKYPDKYAPAPKENLDPLKVPLNPKRIPPGNLNIP